MQKIHRGFFTKENLLIVLLCLSLILLVIFTADSSPIAVEIS